MSETPILNDLKCMTFSKNDISRIENEAYNQALEDFAGKIIDWKPQGEEYRSFKDVVNEVKERLRK